MHQHLQQNHLSLQLMKEHTQPLPLLHLVLVNPHQPILHQCKGQYYHQCHHHRRHQLAPEIPSTDT